jgi:predicted PurR-regulated permease PerM
MEQVDRPAVRGTPMIVLTGAAVVVVLRLGAPIFGPIALSVLLAYVFDPMVGALMRIRVPRVIAALVIYAGLALAGWTVFAATARQINMFVGDVPRSISELRSHLAGPDHGARPGEGLWFHITHAAGELQRTWSGGRGQESDARRVMPVGHQFDVRLATLNATNRLLTIGSQLTLVGLLTFLLLATGDLYKRKMVKIAGRRWEDRKVTIDVIRTIDTQIQRYLGIRLIISVLVAALTAAGLFWLDVSHALVWGAIAGLLNVVPFVGPAVACALITLAALFQFQSLEMTAAAGLVSVGIAALEGNLITPWLTSRAGELNTVAVFVAVLFWGWLWDVWGLLIAIPITVAIKAAADHIEPLQPLGELLGR